MKTDEQFLLNYMYRKGYTDEDMHDPNVLKSVRYSLDFVMLLANRAMGEMARTIKDSLQDAFNNVVGQVRPAIAEMKELLTDVLKKALLEGPSEPKKVMYIPVPAMPIKPMRFTHQVMNKKPRHMVRKIIR